MNRVTAWVVLIALLTMGFAGGCGGGGGGGGDDGPALGILWTATDGGTPDALGQGTLDEVVAKLTSTGRFGSVTSVDMGGTVVTASTLQAFDVILMARYHALLDAASLRTALVTYLAAGRGLVIASPVLANPLRGFQNGDYDVLNNVGFSLSNAALTLGMVHVPNHPIMQGVNTMLGDSPATLFEDPDNPPLAPGATLLAEWSNTAQLVAVRTLSSGARRVDLGFLANSTDISALQPNGWDPNSDALRLMSNALIWASDN